MFLISSVSFLYITVVSVVVVYLPAHFCIYPVVLLSFFRIIERRPGMQANDVVRIGGNLLRVLAARDDAWLCIDCTAARMPFWVPFRGLEVSTPGEVPALIWSLRHSRSRLPVSVTR